MAAISITAASVLASAAATLRREFNFAATVTQGQLVYLNASNQWALVDSDGGLGTGINDLRGFAQNAGAAGQPACVCTSDPDYTPGGTLSNGLAVYAFTTAGAISFADIPTTAASPVFLGLAKSTTKMNFQPSASGVII
jgi:hypothetical protein